MTIISAKTERYPQSLALRVTPLDRARCASDIPGNRSALTSKDLP